MVTEGARFRFTRAIRACPYWNSYADIESSGNDRHTTDTQRIPAAGQGRAGSSGPGRYQTPERRDLRLLRSGQIRLSLRQWRIRIECLTHVRRSGQGDDSPRRLWERCETQAPRAESYR